MFEYNTKDDFELPLNIKLLIKFEKNFEFNLDELPEINTEIHYRKNEAPKNVLDCVAVVFQKEIINKNKNIF
jgi:hypothetical protein